MESLAMRVPYVVPTERFSRCISASKQVRWDIESDVIRGGSFDRASKLLHDGLTLASRLDFLSFKEKVYFSQVQGAPTPTCLGWSSASSAPRYWKSAGTTGWEIKLRSRRWSGSAMRSWSIRRYSVALKH